MTVVKKFKIHKSKFNRECVGLTWRKSHRFTDEDKINSLHSIPLHKINTIWNKQTHKKICKNNTREHSWIYVWYCNEETLLNGTKGRKIQYKIIDPWKYKVLYSKKLLWIKKQWGKWYKYV